MISRRKLRYTLLIVLIGCAILILGCGLTAVAVRQGAIALPALNLDLGSVRLVGLRSRMPDCTSLLVPGCNRLNQIPTAHIYTVWLFVRSEQSSWDRPRVIELLRLRTGN